jgi:hypothetical protein
MVYRVVVSLNSETATLMNRRPAGIGNPIKNCANCLFEINSGPLRQCAQRPGLNPSVDPAARPRRNGARAFQIQYFPAAGSERRFLERKSADGGAEERIRLLERGDRLEICDGGHRALRVILNRTVACIYVAVGRPA